MVINYRLLRVQIHLREELVRRSARTPVRWWVHATLQQAVPMLGVLKKNGKRLDSLLTFASKMINTKEKGSLLFRTKSLSGHDIARATTGPNWTMSEA